jgi:hypothetical protein
MKRISILLLAWASLARLCFADVPATQPADSPEVKEVRKAILDRDDSAAKLSLEDFRKTYYTETDREAVYCDRVAHDGWEAGRVEQLVRDKWGSKADADFAHFCGFSSREDDQVCHISVDGDHAVVTWDIKAAPPESLIKINGRWLTDMHAMFEKHQKENPNFDAIHFPIARFFSSARADIDAGKYDDADAFMADFKAKLGNPEGN